MAWSTCQAEGRCWSIIEPMIVGSIRWLERTSQKLVVDGRECLCFCACCEVELSSVSRRRSHYENHVVEMPINYPQLLLSGISLPRALIQT